MIRAVVFFGLLAFSNAAFVDTLEKCTYTDTDCLKRLIKGALASIAKDGIPEYDIPAIDPLKVENMKFNMMDLAEMTVTEGTIKGLKDCEVNNIKLDLKTHNAVLKLVCDLTAKGHYEVAGSTPALQSIFGAGALKGSGKAKLKVEKLSINVEMKVDVIKRDDNIYIICQKDNVKYEFDLLGGSHLNLDNLYIGDVESSKMVADYYNQNSKTLWKTLAKNLLSSATDYAFETIYKFFSNVPSKYYLTDDLTPFVKN